MSSGVKIIVGIPTFGRSWKMNAESGISGVPPVTADGPGDAGTVTKTPGLMAWQETCLLLHNSKATDVPVSTLYASPKYSALQFSHTCCFFDFSKNQCHNQMQF